MFKLKDQFVVKGNAQKTTIRQSVATASDTMEQALRATKQGARELRNAINADTAKLGGDNVAAAEAQKTLRSMRVTLEGRSSEAMGLSQQAAAELRADQSGAASDSSQKLGMLIHQEIAESKGQEQKLLHGFGGTLDRMEAAEDELAAHQQAAVAGELRAVKEHA